MANTTTKKYTAWIEAPFHRANDRFIDEFSASSIEEALKKLKGSPFLWHLPEIQEWEESFDYGGKVYSIVNGGEFICLHEGE